MVVTIIEIYGLVVILIYLLWTKKNPYIHHYQTGLYLLAMSIPLIPITLIEDDIFGVKLFVGMWIIGILSILVDLDDLWNAIRYSKPIPPRRPH